MTSITDSKENKGRIALCLSGGGYRAALFHLGSLRCLHEMGILENVTTVSSVSGGSILSGYIAKRMFEDKISNGIRFEDWESQVAMGFRRFVRTDMRTIPFLIHLPWNWFSPKWRVRHLQRNYSRNLFMVDREVGSSEMELTEIPNYPMFVFCSTDVTFGVNWIFTRDEIGDYQVGYAKADGFPISLAVTASSCFPPIFGPMVLNLDPKLFKNPGFRGNDRDSLLSHLNLSDGGVYDNLGIEPVDRGYETVIISDGGSPFQYERKSGPLGRLLRYNSVMMRQVGALRKRIFHTEISRHNRNGVYVGISSTTQNKKSDPIFNGYIGQDVREAISSIRTDLDRFEEAEAQILENHGYFEMLRKVKSKLSFLISSDFTPTTPHPVWEDESQVLSALKNSNKRFSSMRLLRTLMRKK